MSTLRWILILTGLTLGCRLAEAQVRDTRRDVVLHRSQVVAVIGLQGGLNTNVGDIGAYVDYHPTQTLGINAGIGAGNGTARWTIGLKFYAGDPTGGFYFWGAYSGCPGRDGVEVGDVEIESGTARRSVTVDIKPQHAITAGLGLQFIVVGPFSIGAYGGYMFPVAKREDSYSISTEVGGKPVTVSVAGNDTILKEIPAGVMIAATLGFTLFN